MHSSEQKETVSSFAPDLTEKPIGLPVTGHIKSRDFSVLWVFPCPPHPHCALATIAPRQDAKMATEAMICLRDTSFSSPHLGIQRAAIGPPRAWQRLVLVLLIRCQCDSRPSPLAEEFRHRFQFLGPGPMPCLPCRSDGGAHAVPAHGAFAAVSGRPAPFSGTLACRVRSRDCRVEGRLPRERQLAEPEDRRRDLAR